MSLCSTKSLYRHSTIRSLHDLSCLLKQVVRPYFDSSISPVVVKSVNINRIAKSNLSIISSDTENQLYLLKRKITQSKVNCVRPLVKTRQCCLSFITVTAKEGNEQSDALQIQSTIDSCCL